MIFLDTNVFAYALDRAGGKKHARAQEVVAARAHDVVVSTQVLIELHAVCTSKLGMPRDDAREAVRRVSAFPTIDADRALVLEAMGLSVRAQVSIFDAMIVCAAQRAGCTTLLTEDLNAGQRFGDVVVENPFAPV